MMKPLTLGAILFLTACAVGSPEVSEATAFVALAKNAQAGGMQITAIDGKPVAKTGGHNVLPGPHKFDVACQLDNGVGTTFSFQTELLPNHSYCFFSRDQGKSCTIIYTRVAWEGEGLVSCN
ncbi:MAG: hypothetical protein ACJAYE_000481 [Candidatus Azotimanducaceae bacterium]|jgi:hypothetical protein